MPVRTIRPGSMSQLEQTLKVALPTFRWFGGKSRVIRRVAVIDQAPLPEAGEYFALLLCRVIYSKGADETYFVPADLRSACEKGLALDPSDTPAFSLALLRMVVTGASYWTGRGRLIASCCSDGIRRQGPRAADPHRLKGEQSNTSIRFGQTYMLKILRRLEEGINPEVELGRHLAAGRGFAHSPRFLGTLEYVKPGELPITLCTLHRFVSAKADAWTAFMERLARWKQTRRALTLPRMRGGWFDAAAHDCPATIRRSLNPFVDWAELLGQRTANLHVALATGNRTPAFVPEPLTGSLQETMARALEAQVDETLALARRALPRLPAPAAAGVGRLLQLAPALRMRFAVLRNTHLDAPATRTHGDYHLGQVLFTGRDFQILDFEGEPARSLEERRRKHSPLRDVAGMLRSFHYAASMGLADLPGGVAERWYAWICAAYFRGYRRAVKAACLPAAEAQVKTLLDIYLVEKALYELRYELNNRPDWVSVPLAGILNLMEEPR